MGRKWTVKESGQHRKTISNHLVGAELMDCDASDRLEIVRPCLIRVIPFSLQHIDKMNGFLGNNWGLQVGGMLSNALTKIETDK